MVHFAFAAMLQVSVLATGANPSYEKAYAASAENGRPLVVLVGTDWCPGCQSMKHSVIPQVTQDGALGKVEFVQVNSDVDPQLADKLMQGRSIPQLIMYRHTSSGWKREQMTGAHSVAEVEGFISKGALENDPSTRVVSHATDK